MRLRRLFVLATTALGVVASAAVTAPPASAAPCADVAVIWGRGTAETAPPVGITGLAFEQELRGRLPGKSVTMSAVDYPASSNFDDRAAFTRNVVVGIKNTQRQIRSTAARCPNTKIVVGGYSQGSVATTYAVADTIDIPAQYLRYRNEAPNPMPADVAKHVAAVIQVAPPSRNWIRELGAPPMNVGAAYRHKTTRFCVAGDNVCDGSPVGSPTAQHMFYVANGDMARGAEFAARHIH